MFLFCLLVMVKLSDLFKFCYIFFSRSIGSFISLLSYLEIIIGKIISNYWTISSLLVFSVLLIFLYIPTLYNNYYLSRLSMIKMISTCISRSRSMNFRTRSKNSSRSMNFRTRPKIVQFNKFQNKTKK